MKTEDKIVTLVLIVFMAVTSIIAVNRYNDNPRIDCNGVEWGWHKGTIPYVMVDNKDNERTIWLSGVTETQAEELECTMTGTFK